MGDRDSRRDLVRAESNGSNVMPTGGMIGIMAVRAAIQARLATDGIKDQPYSRRLRFPHKKNRRGRAK